MHLTHSNSRGSSQLTPKYQVRLEEENRTPTFKEYHHKNYNYSTQATTTTTTAHKPNSDPLGLNFTTTGSTGLKFHHHRTHHSTTSTTGKVLMPLQSDQIWLIIRLHVFFFVCYYQTTCIFFCVLLSDYMNFFLCVLRCTLDITVSWSDHCVCWDVHYK